MNRAQRRQAEREQRKSGGRVAEPVAINDAVHGALGSVAVLSVGDGDLALTFDKSKPVERERAAQVVTEMLERGYAILIQVGEKDGEPVYQRAKGFDPETCEYLIVGAPDAVGALPAAPSRALVPEVVETGPRRRGRPRKHDIPTRVPAERTRTVAVARTAGG